MNRAPTSEQLAFDDVCLFCFDVSNGDTQVRPCHAISNLIL